MPTQRTYSRTTRDAAALLGGPVRAARKDRRMTAQEVADRAGISRSLLQRIETGALKCEIGATFEVTTVLGVRLFDLDERALGSRIRQTAEKLTLLPKSVRKKRRVVADDF